MSARGRRLLRPEVGGQPVLPLLFAVDDAGHEYAADLLDLVGGVVPVECSGLPGEGGPVVAAPAGSSTGTVALSPRAR